MLSFWTISPSSTVPGFRGFLRHPCDLDGTLPIDQTASHSPRGLVVHRHQQSTLPVALLGHEVIVGFPSYFCEPARPGRGPGRP